ncbi:MAG TPA: hypothetical protein VGM60_00280 [Pseudonocardia sp.]|jgi:hypothetical protein|uniref:hypothetical protein n=1 Tax=Pseudonocardia sp. TaxID=60912 RepID=UPI002F413F1A
MYATRKTSNGATVTQYVAPVSAVITSSILLPVYLVKALSGLAVAYAAASRHHQHTHRTPDCFWCRDAYDQMVYQEQQDAKHAATSAKMRRR